MTAGRMPALRSSARCEAGKRSHGSAAVTPVCFQGREGEKMEERVPDGMTG